MLYKPHDLSSVPGLHNPDVINLSLDPLTAIQAVAHASTYAHTRHTNVYSLITDHLTEKDEQHPRSDLRWDSTGNIDPLSCTR